MRKKRSIEDVELEMTTFMNLMVVLIPFLLLTAVFSKITIQEMNLPTQAGGASAPIKPPVTIEVIVRKNALQIGNGQSVQITIAKSDGEYNYQKLSESLGPMKEANPEKEDVVVLLEPDIDYASLIGVMDAVKVLKVKIEGQEKPEKKPLFPQVSIGDAP
ncbi:MAG: biopolymer transporter ExbD [Hylemonella sp.]|nr:biopolymer transporter ExbD [Hylemonella sp.]